MLFDFVSFIPRAVVQGIPLLYGSTGRDPHRKKSGNPESGHSRVSWAASAASSAPFFYEQAQPLFPAFPAIVIPLLCSPLGVLPDGPSLLLPDLVTSGPTRTSPVWP